MYPDRIDTAKTKIPGADKAVVYRDYKQLLADPTSTPCSSRPPSFSIPSTSKPPSLAKKHVYCEKPAGADVAG